MEAVELKTDALYPWFTARSVCCLRLPTRTSRTVEWQVGPPGG